MTALIKSTDGSGWVEARVGDIVSCNVYWCVVRHTEPFIIESADNPLLIGPANPENCQLIERPFQYGDDVEIKVSGRWMKAKYTGQGLQKAYAACRALRHSSPLLRPVGGV